MQGIFLIFLGILRGHYISSTTTESQTRLPAGWYTDPGNTGGKRWWDGVKWTDHLKMPEVVVAKTAPPQNAPYGLGSVRPSATGPIPVSAAVAVPSRGLRGAENNRAAWISLLFGLVAVALTFVAPLPGASIYWVGGAAVMSLGFAVAAVAGRVAGSARNVVAPVVGVVLGATATIVIVLGIGLLGLVNSATGALLPTSSTTADATQAAPLTSAEPLVFPTNGALTDSGKAVQQIATAMNTTYAAGKASLAAGQSWPATLKLTTTQVIDLNGTVLVTVPAGHLLGYERSADKKSYTFRVTGVNPTQVAIYNSATDRFSFSCLDSDKTCVPST
jgi:Protein of unknown function (DUF2510)